MTFAGDFEWSGYTFAIQKIFWIASIKKFWIARKSTWPIQRYYRWIGDKKNNLTKVNPFGTLKVSYILNIVIPNGLIL